MAKFLSIVGEISGAIAGIVYSRNKGGPYFRLRANPVNPQSARQTAIRERVASLAKSFGAALTEVQRAGWERLAATITQVNTLGMAHTLTALNWYVRVNARRALSGAAPISDAPIDQEVQSSTEMEITSSVGGQADLVLTFTPPLISTERLVVYGAVNISPGINNANSLRKFLGVSALEAASPVTMSLPADVGNFVTGSKTSIKVHRMRDENGAMSPGIIAAAING